jgi:hypothetical protein
MPLDGAPQSRPGSATLASISRSTMPHQAMLFMYALHSLRPEKLVQVREYAAMRDSLPIREAAYSVGRRLLLSPFARSIDFPFSVVAR